MGESLRLGEQATGKFEEASRLMSNEQHRKGLTLIAASYRKDLEIEQLFKAQAQLPSDTTLTSAKAFNEKFAHLNELIQQTQKEKENQFDEGRRLMLTK